MATYALIHGAGDVGWYWHLVADELRRRGHEVVAPDLPCDDDAAGWSEYADTVVDAIGGRSELVVVAQSLGGFTGPIVCDRTQADALVFVAGMVPVPGETGDDWWADTGYVQAAREQESGDQGERAVFYHDVEPELAAEALSRGRDQSGTPMGQPFPLQALPDVPTRFVLCIEDRFFPSEWLRGVVRERLGIEPDELTSGHTPALSHPKELTEHLEAIRLSIEADQPEGDK